MPVHTNMQLVYWHNDICALFTREYGIKHPEMATLCMVGGGERRAGIHIRLQEPCALFLGTELRDEGTADHFLALVRSVGDEDVACVSYSHNAECARWTLTLSEYAKTLPRFRFLFDPHNASRNPTTSDRARAVGWVRAIALTFTDTQP